jgi:hypothetical protein
MPKFLKFVHFAFKGIYDATGFDCCNPRLKHLKQRFLMFLAFLLVSTSMTFLWLSGELTCEPVTTKDSNAEENTVKLRCPVDNTEVIYTLNEVPKGHLIEDRDYCIRLVPNIDFLTSINLYSARLAHCPSCGYAAKPEPVYWTDGCLSAAWYKANVLTNNTERSAQSKKAPWIEFERFSYMLQASNALGLERERALVWLDASFCLRTGFWDEVPNWGPSLRDAFSELNAVTTSPVPLVTPSKLYEDAIEIPAYFEDLLINPKAAGSALGILGIYWLARGETTRSENAVKALNEIEDTLGSKLSGTGPNLLKQLDESGLLKTMKDYQVSSIELFETALGKGQITSNEMSIVYFHLGELYRRTGDYRDAERYYRLVETTAGASVEIVNRAKSGLELVEADQAMANSLENFVTADFIDEIPLEDVIKTPDVPYEDASGDDLGEPEGNAIVIGGKK